MNLLNKLWDWAKGFFSGVFGLIVIILFFVLFIFIFEGAIHIGEKILPFLTTLTGWLSGIFFFILIPLGFFRKTKAFSAIGSVYFSLFAGFTLWFYSAVTTYYLWGMFALILGIAFFGVGVFPLALLATIFQGEWGIFWNLAYLAALTYGARFLGLYFAKKADEQEAASYQASLQTDTYETDESDLFQEAEIVDEQKFCTNCGKPMLFDANFCRYCGNKKIVPYQEEHSEITDAEIAEISTSFEDNKKGLNLGKTETGEEVNLNFESEGVRFVLLIGRTGSGKSVFSKYLHKELASHNASARFLVMDMKAVEFLEYNRNDMHNLLFKPVITDIQTGVRELENIAENYGPTEPKLVIHIDECDMVIHERERTEKAMEKIILKANVLVIYVTSRIDASYLKNWIQKFIDLEIVFKVTNENDSKFLLGNDSAHHFKNAGERILAFNDKQIKCLPLDVMHENMKVYRGTLEKPIVFPESVIIMDENLDSIDFDKVIYCEVSPMGAMGNEGGILIYMLSGENNLVTYETNASLDQQSYDAMVERINKNVDFFVNYSGGFGNYVYIKKNAQLEIDEKYGCFWYHSHNTKLRIGSSVQGVFLSVVADMRRQNPNKNHE